PERQQKKSTSNSCGSSGHKSGAPNPSTGAGQKLANRSEANAASHDVVFRIEPKTITATSPSGLSKRSALLSQSKNRRRLVAEKQPRGVT
ncbi:MAG: hypothetical protein WBF58_18750, partial [Xanthobacteraceae bacterium]